MGLIVRNARIFNGREILPETSIFIEGNRIVGIGEAPLREKKSEDEEILDAEGRVVIPGLIDCHTHLYQTFGRGLMDDLHITEWLEIIWQFPQLWSEEALYYSTLLGAMEAIKSGTTTVADLVGESGEETVIQALIDSGLRAVVGKMQNDYPEGRNTPVKTTEECLEDSERFLKKWHKAAEGRIRVKLSFAGLPACTQELVEGLLWLSQKYKVGLHAHAAEGKEPTEQVRRRFGSGEIQALKKLGALRPSTLLAHVIWVEEGEIGLLAESGTSVVHCPFTNCKLTDGLSPMFQMEREGVNITFGCDGAASSSNYDLLLEARLGSMLQKVSSMEEKAFSPPFVFRALTLNAARALELEGEIGQIGAGFKADLVVLDPPPSKNLSESTFLNNLIYAMSGTEIVKDVLIDGKIVVKNRKMVFLDEALILKKAQEIFAREKEKILSKLNKNLKK